MARIDGLIFGYRRISVASTTLAEAASLLLRGGISARVTADGVITVRERDALKARALLSGKIDYEMSETLGALGSWKRVKYKIGLVSALIFSVILLILSSNVVWDIRVEGNLEMPDSAVAYRLAECGFTVGKFWWNIDRSEVETAVLDKAEELSWININRRGAVAYVTVKEKETTADGEVPNLGYANIVAAVDCVIEEITVKCGTAAVKVGDSVKAGDLLISGVAVTESGADLCHAEGRVVGRISDTVSVSVERGYEKTVSTEEEVRSVDLEIFGFSLNIFKRYGKVAEDCVIIEDVKDFSLFGKCKLPIEISVSSAVKRKTVRQEYTDDELVRIATSRLNSATASRLASCDLVRIKSTGEFTDNGYLMKNELVFLADIGSSVPFSVEEN